MRILLLITVLLLTMLIPPATVFASDIDDAQFEGVITVSNDGTEADAVSVNMTLDSDGLANSGYASANLSDIAIRYAGEDVAFMPGYDGSPWAFFVDDILEEQQLTYNFYSGNVSGGKYAYFPDTGGMTTSDNDTNLEYSDNFTYEFSGYVNTSVTGNITSKDDAIWMGVTAPGEITAQIVGTSANVVATDIDSGEYIIRLDGVYTDAVYADQETSNAYGITTPIYYGYGQKFNYDFIGVVNGIDWQLNKAGTPSGLAYARVRYSDNLSIIGTLGSLDVSTLTETPTYYTFNTNPVLVTSEVDILITIEYNDSTGSDYIYASFNNTSLVSDSVRWRLPDKDPSGDMRWRNLDVSDGLYISIDGEVQGISGITDAVPDTPNDWVDGDPDVTPYIEYVKRYVDGVLQQHIEWEYGTTFTDLSGNSHDATPAFRTESSDSDVTATLTSFEPSSKAIVASVSLLATGILTGDPDEISQMYTELEFEHIPGAEAVNAMLEEGEIPEALWWFPFIFGIIAIAALILYGVTTGPMGQGLGSLLTMCIFIESFLAVIAIMGPIPFWPAIMFPIFAGAMIMSQKQFSWG